MIFCRQLVCCPPYYSLRASIAWHYDTGMHLMRLILSGIFDKRPDLKIIVAHWGKTLPYFPQCMSGGLRPQITGLQPDMSYYFGTMSTPIHPVCSLGRILTSA